MNESLSAYCVGPLLYCPANNKNIVDSLANEKFGKQFSLALCLEDTIHDGFVAEAEQILISSIRSLDTYKSRKRFFLPKIFIRVRQPGQINNLLDRLGDSRKLIAGFNLPKYSLQNSESYIRAVQDANKYSSTPIYMMPILEDPSLINLEGRRHALYSMKRELSHIAPYVLNIRVGGNDLCSLFGFRRHSTESIYKIRPIANIFSDIISVFGLDYVVSGPVFEYYNGEHWKDGLVQELDDDRLCGFVGKTVIHPKQIQLVNEAYKIPLKDYNDAKSILEWDDLSPTLVSGSIVKERMNEYKTHYNWAMRTMLLAEAYGLK